MSVISVCPDRLEKESASIIQLAQTLRDYNKTVSSISVRLSMKIVAQRRLDLMLKEASEQILSEAAKMETFGGALAQIARARRAIKSTSCFRQLRRIYALHLSNLGL